jgi:hypothetical protein
VDRKIPATTATARQINAPIGKRTRATNRILRGRIHPIRATTSHAHVNINMYGSAFALSTAVAIVIELRKSTYTFLTAVRSAGQYIYVVNNPNSCWLGAF